jgi:uncharacterized protein (DUF2267 family)
MMPTLFDHPRAPSFMATHTEIAGFERSLQLTTAWLRDIAVAMDHPDRNVAYHALRGVFFATRDRIPPTEVMDFAAQLPMLARGLFFEGYQMTDKPLKYRDAEPFLEQVRTELANTPATQGDTEAAVTAVFTVISDRVTTGEAANVRRMLPEDVRALWPEDALAAS